MASPIEGGARGAAWEETKLAARAYARNPCSENEEAVRRAVAKLRMTEPPSAQTTTFERASATGAAPRQRRSNSKS
jgi:hypothetical protein